MKFLHPFRSHLLLSALVLAMAVLPAPSTAQQPGSGVKEAYFRAVGEYFAVPEAEVGIIGEWDLNPDELPVVLFLAHRAGVSPDALIGLRRGGRPWREVAGRFGIEPGDFHLPLSPEADPGPLARAYGEFRQRPAREWSLVLLDDREIVALVNMRVLSEQTGVSPQRVLAGFVEAGSFMACYPLLLRR